MKCSQYLGWRDGSAAKSPVTFPEDLSSVPSTHTGKLTTTGTSSFIGSDTVFWPTDTTSHAGAHACAHIHIDKNEIKHNLKCSISYFNCKLKLSRATTIYTDNVGATRETPSHCWRGWKWLRSFRTQLNSFLPQSNLRSGNHTTWCPPKWLYDLFPCVNLHLVFTATSVLVGKL